MVEVIGVLSETGLLGVDCQLDLTNSAIVKLDVNEDIIGLGPKPILDPYDL